jgi:beta-glucosidase
LNAKYDLGLFQDPYKYCDSKELNWYFTKDLRAESRSIAAQPLVPLKITTSYYQKRGEP